jgi:hypothetical protein
MRSGGVSHEIHTSAKICSSRDARGCDLPGSLFFGVLQTFSRGLSDLVDNLGDGNVRTQVVADEDGFDVVSVQSLGDEVVTGAG